jgi:hypothetical protein
MVKMWWAGQEQQEYELVDQIPGCRILEPSISAIYSKLAMKTFDVYANILKCMFRIRFNGGATRSEAYSDAQPTSCVVTSLIHPIRTLPQSDKYKRRKKESPKEREI